MNFDQLIVLHVIAVVPTVIQAWVRPGALWSLELTSVRALRGFLLHGK